MLTLKLIHEARERIRGRVHHTPIVSSRLFNEAAGKQVYFKCENLQRAGAFKIRGATNKILSLTPAEKARGIVAFSSGNHAQAVALAGREAGVRVVVAMPDDAPKMKVAATRAYGAEIIFYDRLKEDREAFALDAELPSEEELDHARGSVSGRNRALLDTVAGAVKEELLRIKDALEDPSRIILEI